MLVIQLADLSDWPLKGPKNESYKGILPKRMHYVYPPAAPALREVIRSVPGIAFSDMLRDPIASLEARRTKRGVQRPGFSGHNYGISFDVDVDQTLAASMLSYPELVDQLVSCGWTPHRTDKKRGLEDWHFNYLGMGSSPPIGSRGPQLWIEQTYGNDLSGDDAWAQTMLAKLGYYKGEIDGDFGPLSRAALMSMEKAYDLVPDGILDSLAERTLAIASAEKFIVPVSWDRGTSQPVS